MVFGLSRSITPYCGAAPVPAGLAADWNFDLPLITVLIIVLAFYLTAPSPTSDARWRGWCFVGGWAVAAFALISPLCPLSVALFSARIGEHMLLATVSAPLVALGRPFARIGLLAARIAGRAMVQRRHAEPQPVLAASALAVVLWFWHAPAPYDATFASPVAFWAMQITLYGSALWFWSALFNRGENQMASGMVAVFATTGQMGLLGAIITFAGRPLYAAHFATTFAWGLTPLQDQQLGGVVMWIPAGAIFAAALAGSLSHVMRQTELRSAKVA